jgi:hypothetical protein
LHFQPDPLGCFIRPHRRHSRHRIPCGPAGRSAKDIDTRDPSVVKRHSEFRGPELFPIGAQADLPG